MQHTIVSAKEWMKARTELLAKEKAFTRAYDKLAAEQRALPWVKISKDYVFESPTGKVTLSELFDGRSQLFIKNFMLSPGQTTQCVGCSLEVDHVAGLLEHIENHDISYVVVAPAPVDEIEAVRTRMGWRFRWVSSHGCDFNADMNAMFAPPGSGAGNSIFFKDDAGQIFHTYSTYGRGGEAFLGVYRIFDLTPKGRDENGPYHSLADWARPHTMYAKGGTVERNGRYHAAGKSRV